MPNLGVKVTNTLLNWLKKFLDEAGEQLINILYIPLSMTMEALSYAIIGVTELAEQSFKPEEGYPEEIQRWLDSFHDKPWQERALNSFFFLMNVPLAFLSSYGQPLQMKIQQGAMEASRPNIPDQQTLIQGFWKGTIPPGVVYVYLRKWGFEDEDIDRMIGTAYSPVSPEFYVQNWLRFGISDDELQSQLEGHGYRVTDVAILKRLAMYIPPPQDLIHMAVREAFTPEIAETFGQYEQFPPAFAEWALKLGISEDWAKAYWAAHWELPSLQMGFEMLHRRIIDDSMLDMLMRAQDVMPFWREKLKLISYNPYTRVDVRRMYNVDVLSEQDVYNTYRDLGYDHEHALRLQEFTIKNRRQESKDISKSEILKGYNNKIFTYNETAYMLVALGYSQDETAYLLALEDAKFAEEEEKIAIELLQTKHKAGQISLDDFRIGLGKLNLPANRIDLLVAKQELVGTIKATLPTKEDIIRWYNLGKIDSSEAATFLDTMGYDQKYVDLYLAEIPKTPSAALAIRWLNKGLIDAKQAEKYLGDLGYAKTEIKLLIDESTAREAILDKLPSLAVVKRWYATGYIPAEDAISYLQQMGYGEKEIILFMTEWTPEEFV